MEKITNRIASGIPGTEASKRLDAVRSLFAQKEREDKENKEEEAFKQQYERVKSLVGAEHYDSHNKIIEKILHRVLSLDTMVRYVDLLEKDISSLRTHEREVSERFEEGGDLAGDYSGFALKFFEFENHAQIGKIIRKWIHVVTSDLLMKNSQEKGTPKPEFVQEMETYHRRAKEVFGDLYDKYKDTFDDLPFRQGRSAKELLEWLDEMEEMRDKQASPKSARKYLEIYIDGLKYDD